MLLAAPRFSIGALLLAVTAIAVLLAGVIHPRLDRQRSVQQLESSCDTLDWLGQAEPDLIDRILGVGGPVTYVSFSGTYDSKVSEDALRILARMPPLKTLHLANVRFESRTHLPQVEGTLDIWEMQGEGAGEDLASLIGRQSQLVEIAVFYVPAFDDSHVRLLARNRTLRTVTLYSTSVAGPGFESFSLPDYDLELKLDGPLTCEGVASIASIPGLTSLQLGIESEVCGCLSALEAASSLSDLYIDFSDAPCVPDAGMLESLSRSVARFDFAPPRPSRQQRRPVIIPSTPR